MAGLFAFQGFDGCSRRTAGVSWARAAEPGAKACRAAALKERCHPLVFRRRRPLSVVQKLRLILLPPRGWLRPVQYLRHRLLRLPDEPQRIARGLACGIFVSFTPLFGFHFLLAAACAWLVRGNVMAAFLGTAVGNPITFPLIAALSVEIGRMLTGMGGGDVPAHQIVSAFILAGDAVGQNLVATVTPEETRWAGLGRFFHGMFVPYLAGGVLLGLGAALAGYWLCLPVVRKVHALRSRRRRICAERRRAGAALRLNRQAEAVRPDRTSNP